MQTPLAARVPLPHPEREALRRDEGVKDARLGTFEGTSKERTALRRQLDKRLHALRAKIKKAEKD